MRIEAKTLEELEHMGQLDRIDFCRKQYALLEAETDQPSMFSDWFTPYIRDSHRVKAGYWRMVDPVESDNLSLCRVESTFEGLLKNQAQEWWVHWSTKTDGSIAFQDDFEKRRKDIWKVMKAGKFLRYLFTKHGHSLPDHEIRDYAQLLVNGEINTNMEVKFAEDSKEILEVYQKGPPSCMGYSKDHKNYKNAWPYHPVEAYGSGHWQVAYDTGYECRAVCHKATKTYYRIYGDRGREFGAALSKLGYRKVYSDDWIDILDEHCPKFLLLEGKRGHAFPYIDGYDDEVYLHPDREHLCIGGDGLSSIGRTQTSYDSLGVCEEDVCGVECGHCGEMHDRDDDEAEYDDYLEESVCPVCAMDMVMFYDSHGMRATHVDNIEVQTMDGANFVTVDDARLNGYQQCDYSKEWYPENEMVYTEDGYWVHEDDVKYACTITEDTGTVWYYTFDLIEHEGDYYEHVENIPNDDEQQDTA